MNNNIIIKYYLALTVIKPACLKINFRIMAINQ